MNSPLRAHDCVRETGEAQDSASPAPVERPRPVRRRGHAMRMVYEDELRRACNGRALDELRMARWMQIRRKLPINRWIDRNTVKNADRNELMGLRKEISEYLTVFHEEAKSFPFELDMNRNYYKAAVNLMSSFPQGKQLSEKEQRIITGLMVMVDLKDARLATQILASIA